jgi:hypothetical protein
MTDVRDRLRFSRSARDIARLLGEHPELRAEAIAARPALRAAASGEEALGAALDAERRESIRKNEASLSAYGEAARAWRAA